MYLLFFATNPTGDPVHQAAVGGALSQVFGTLSGAVPVTLHLVSPDT